MIRPINVSDTSFQGKGLKLRQPKKVVRQVLNVTKLDARQANNLKGIARTPLRFGLDEVSEDVSVGSGQGLLAFTACVSVGYSSASV